MYVQRIIQPNISVFSCLIRPGNAQRRESTIEWIEDKSREQKTQIKLNSIWTKESWSWIGIEPSLKIDMILLTRFNFFVFGFPPQIDSIDFFKLYLRYKHWWLFTLVFHIFSCIKVADCTIFLFMIKILLEYYIVCWCNIWLNLKSWIKHNIDIVICMQWIVCTQNYQFFYIKCQFQTRILGTRVF